MKQKYDAAEDFQTMMSLNRENEETTMVVL